MCELPAAANGSVDSRKERHMSTHFRLLQLGGLAVAAGCLLLTTALAQQPAGRAAHLYQAYPEGDLPRGAYLLVGDPQGGLAFADAAELSPYWIGVGCEPASAALRAQLKLPEDEGLVVLSVAENSPAAAAGLQVNDVLLAAGDTPLKSVADLVRVVDNAKETDITFKLLRGGESTTLVIRPAKRPDAAALAPVPAAPGTGVGRAARALRWLAPGVVMGRELFLPKDMSVTITVEHGKPARIAVKKGDQSWEVEQDKLNELPPEIRGPVQGLLMSMPRLAAGIVPPSVEVEVFGEGEPPNGGAPARIFRWLAPNAQDAQLEQRLDELKRQIDELRKAIEELNKKQAE
jgi:membrane-associated protease RseP (regulator of RpoE activity)